MSEVLLQIENLSIGYNHKAICSQINASVSKGELVVLAGKNGAGKSTLAKTLLGIQAEISGNIFIENKNIKNWNSKEKARKISVVFSSLEQIPSISVEELMILGRLPYHNWSVKLSEKENQLINEALKLIGIEELKTQKLTELSDGQLQMVMIARALAQDTPLIILDEPTSHLDLENQFKVYETIYKLTKKTNKTFLIITHQVELALQNATQLWWINEGEFHAGFPEEVALEKKIFEELSQNYIRFNYEKGSFGFKHLELKPICFRQENSDSNYWLRHALLRHGFYFDDDSDKVIETKDGAPHLHIGKETRRFKNISELIDFLINY